MPDRDKQLSTCRADYEAIQAEMKKVQHKLENLEARIYGAHGEIGDMKEMRGWMESLSHEIGKVQVALRNIKEALK